MFAHGTKLEGEQSQVIAVAFYRTSHGPGRMGSASRMRVDREIHFVQEMLVVCAAPCARYQGAAGSQTNVSASGCLQPNG